MLDDFKTFLQQTFAGVTNPTHEGERFIWIALYVALAGLLMTIFWRPRGDVLGLLPLGALAALALAFFFRNPERVISAQPDDILCPADGRVLKVGTEGDKDVVVVRIFLSVLDVHIQRAPMDGTVGEIVYTKGTFEVASAAQAARNERNLIPIANGARFAHVEQITGAVARRIACWVKQGQSVKAGERLGLIYFGSQVAVYLPAAAVRIMVKPGQRVEGGLTVLGLWRQ